MSHLMSHMEWKLTIDSVEGRARWKQSQESMVLALILAVRSGDITGVEDFLRKGVSVNQVLKQQRTALGAAASQNNLGMIDLLLKNRATVGIRFDRGRDAAWVSMERGHIEAFESLINAGASLSLRINEEGNYTRLIEAVRRSNVSAVRFLAYKKANLDERDEWGRTALHHNFSKDPYMPEDVEIARILLDMGGNPELEDQDGVSILNLAVLPEHLVLLERRDIDVTLKAAQKGAAPAPGVNIQENDFPDLDGLGFESQPEVSQPKPPRPRL